MTIRLLGFFLVLVMLRTTPAHAQDVETLYAAITALETSLKQFAAHEADQQNQQLRGLHDELTALRSRIEHQEALSAPAGSKQNTMLNAQIEAIHQSQQRFLAQPPPNPRDLAFEVLTERLRQLLSELKTYVEEPRRNEDPPATPGTPFAFSGQIRHRSEIDGKAVYPDAEALRVHLLRTRIGLSFQPLDEVQAFVQIQDARTFGSEDPTLGRGTLDGKADALDFHQAYFAVSSLFGAPLSLKIGRQELAYGNQRLIGSVGWSNIGRTFDAATASYSTPWASLDFFSAKLVDTPTRSSSQNLHGLYGTFDLGKLHRADGFILIDNNTEKLQLGAEAGKPKLVRYTIGTYLRGTKALFDYEVEAIYQAGKTALTDSLARASIGAYLISGSLGYTFNTQKNLHLRVLYTRLSGDNNTEDATARTFNTLFATNHKFYGYLDYFPKTFSAYGLQNIALSLGYSPTPALALNLALHHFSLDQPALLANDASLAMEAQTLGEEIDVTAKVKYNQHFSFVTGASLFLADPLMERTLGKATGYKVYLMTVVNF